MSKTDPNQQSTQDRFPDRDSRLRAILENAVDAIITIDARGTIESVNPATTRLFGYTPVELVGNNVKMLMPPPYREEHDGYLVNYLTTGEGKIIGIGREVVGRRKNGETFPMHLAVSEIGSGNHRIFTGIVRDISDLKSAQEKLTRLNEELEQRVQQRTAELREAQAELVKKERLATLGQVSGGIAHEIRNPLNAVKTSAYYLLNAGNPSAEKTREHLERIDRQVTLIDNVVTALSDVAKLPEPRLQPIPVLRCLQDVLQTVSLPSNIEVSIDIPDSLSPVLADEIQIPIVFRNLLRNARDAISSGGQISISAHEADGHVRIAVADTGEGITSEHLSRIMEPLYSTKARGMGLGLAICRTILEKNGGDLQVESQPGHGSTFTVDLRAAPSEDEGLT